MRAALEEGSLRKVVQPVPPSPGKIGDCFVGFGAPQTWIWIQTGKLITWLDLDKVFNLFETHL